jgi:CubicO group peptidase (beta-lactamase class C family)
MRPTFPDMTRMILWLGFALWGHSTCAQHTSFIDSLRHVHGVPTIGYAVLTADSVLAMEVVGVHRTGTDQVATLDDRFRIGSCTKTVTSHIAAQLVHSGVITWNTRLFDLYPEWKAGSKKVYQQLTLLDLLTFRTRLVRYTYTDPEPLISAFSGDADAQRTAFAQWALQQPPVPKGDGTNFSNLAYVLAGTMLERASGRSYAELVEELSSPHGIDFQFGAPNRFDSLAIWGHRPDGTAEAPADDIKLEWLMAAGNLNTSLPDLATYTQVHLRGLEGRDPILSSEAFRNLHMGSPIWALGWMWTTDTDGSTRSFHVGNPGAFLTYIFVHHTTGRGYVLVANRQSEGTQEALDALYLELVRTH